MNAGGEAEVAFLRAAVRQAVSRTSIRAVSKGAGVSHGAIFNFVSGRTRRLYGTTLGKLRDWCLRQWASGGDGLTQEVAAYLVEQMLAAVPPGSRTAAALELVQALEQIYHRHRAPRPAWLPAVRNEYLREARAEPPGASW
jgi:AcrR family transcriptional regulator